MGGLWGCFQYFIELRMLRKPTDGIGTGDDGFISVFADFLHRGADQFIRNSLTAQQGRDKRVVDVDGSGATRRKCDLGNQISAFIQAIDAIGFMACSRTLITL